MSKFKFANFFFYIKVNYYFFYRHFQFGWIANLELVNSIAMMVVPLPNLLVINTTTNHHHFPEDEAGKLTPHAIEIFLEQIHSENVPVRK